jgi:hypothetical protein
MKRVMVLVYVCVLALPCLGDMPSMRLDGSWSKDSLHPDDYPFTELDYSAMEKNPFGIGIKGRVPGGTPESAEMIEKIKVACLPETVKEIETAHVKTVQKEFELTEQERKTVEAYPSEFPLESKLGKRVQISRVLSLGDREYSFNQCQMIGKGDWNGDGRMEIFVRFNDGATHAGAASEIRVFSENGDFVWATTLSTLHMGWAGVLDVDGDGRAELVFAPRHDQDYLILAASRPDQTLEPYENLDPEFSRPKPSSRDIFQSPIRKN